MSTALHPRGCSCVLCTRDRLFRMAVDDLERHQRENGGFGIERRRRAVEDGIEQARRRAVDAVLMPPPPQAPVELARATLFEYLDNDPDPADAYEVLCRVAEQLGRR